MRMNLTVGQTHEYVTSSYMCIFTYMYVLIVQNKNVNRAHTRIQDLRRPDGL